ncbi:MAG: DUF4097 domain-containing protein [Pseudobutyrivibrio sp.]|nr:DUF4097 domain-containing protein [Pseudobutyrivibrio sp.]
MNKKSYTLYYTILTVVTVAAILIGLYINVWTNIGHIFSKKQNVVEDTVEINGSFENLVVDMDAVDLDISYGKNASVSYRIYESCVPEVSVENNTLVIESKCEESLGRIGINSIGKDFKVSIVIPEGTQIKNASILADAGNLQLKALEIENAEVEADLGNIEIHDGVMSKLDITADCGNIELYNSTVNSIVGHADLGNLEAHNSKIASGKCTADMGNVILEGEIGDVDVSCEVGNAQIK